MLEDGNKATHINLDQRLIRIDSPEIGNKLESDAAGDESRINYEDENVLMLLENVLML